MTWRTRRTDKNDDLKTTNRKHQVNECTELNARP